MASAGTEEWGHARARLPAEAADGNPGEYNSESPEGVETRQEGPWMPKTAAITSPAGKCGGGLQTGGWGRQARKAGTTKPCWSEDLWAQERWATPQVRTQRRAAWLVDGRLKGWRKRTRIRRDVRDQT